MVEVKLRRRVQVDSDSKIERRAATHAHSAVQGHASVYSGSGMFRATRYSRPTSSSFLCKTLSTTDNKLTTLAFPRKPGKVISCFGCFYSWYKRVLHFILSTAQQASHLVHRSTYFNMSSESKPRVVVVGATCATGTSIVNGLLESSNFVSSTSRSPPWRC